MTEDEIQIGIKPIREYYTPTILKGRYADIIRVKYNLKREADLLLFKDSMYFWGLNEISRKEEKNENGEVNVTLTMKKIGALPIRKLVQNNEEKNVE